MRSSSRGLPNLASRFDSTCEFWASENCLLVVLARELCQFVRFFVQIVGELLFLFGIEFPAKLLAFRLKFPRALNHGLVLCHVALLHRLIGGFEIGDVIVITPQIFIGRLAAQRRANIQVCGG